MRRDAKKEKIARYKLELISPAAFLGIDTHGKFTPSRFTSFDQYDGDQREPELLKTLGKHFRLLLINIYGRDQSLVKIANEYIAISKDDESEQRSDKMGMKLNAILSFVGIGGNHAGFHEAYNPFSPLQFINPLKLAELAVSSIRLLLHFMLTVSGSKVDAFANDQHPVIKYTLKSLVALIGLVRFVVDTGMQITKLTVRAIASPFHSFHELNAINPFLGLLSATVSTGALLAALITAPLWLPFVGVSAGAASVIATLPLWVKPVVGVLTMLWVMTSGLISDAYIIGRDFGNIKNSLVPDGHPSHRKGFHKKYKEGDLTLRAKVYKDYAGLLLGTVTGILPFMMVVGLVSGLAKRSYRTIINCGHVSDIPPLVASSGESSPLLQGAQDHTGQPYDEAQNLRDSDLAPQV